MSESTNQPKETQVQSSNSKKEEIVPLLFLGNLAPDVRDTDLKSFFSEVGNVKMVKLPTSHSGETKGVAYIQYENIQQAQKAIQELDGKKFQGRHIRVQFARPFSETERKRAEKRQSQSSKPSKRGSDVYSPERIRRSSSGSRRDYDIPRDQYDDIIKSGSSSQSIISRKPSSPPLLKRREAYDERDRESHRDRYERDRGREADRHRDYYEREPIDHEYERDRGIYRDPRLRDRDLREQDLRDWDRIRSDREYESRREPAILYDPIHRIRDYDRDIDRSFRDRIYERPRDYYDRDEYYIDRDRERERERERDRDRDYYHALYSERAPIQYEREFEVPYETQAPQIQTVPPQLPPPSPQLTPRDYARIRAAAAPPPLPPLPEYDTRELDEYDYYQRAQSTAQQTSTPTRIPQAAPPSHYLDYDDQGAIPTEIKYDNLAPPPIPAPPPLAAPQSLQGAQPIPSPQALQKLGQLPTMRLPPGFDLGQPYALGPILPPPPQTRQQVQQTQQPPPLPLPARLAAPHSLVPPYDQQIDPQNQ